MEHITSRQNALMTHIRKLNASRAYRRASGEYLCDGVKLLEEALRWNAPLKTVVLSEGVDAPALPSGVRAVQVPADVMRSISPMETPQGALFTVRLPDTALPETLTSAHYLVLDGVQDPGNVGTIWRTADAAGFGGLLLGANCADPYSPKVQRAAMGSGFRLPAIPADPLCEALAALRGRGRGPVPREKGHTPDPAAGDREGRSACAGKGAAAPGRRGAAVRPEGGAQPAGPAGAGPGLCHLLQCDAGGYGAALPTGRGSTAGGLWRRADQSRPVRRSIP